MVMTQRMLVTLRVVDRKNLNKAGREYYQWELHLEAGISRLREIPGQFRLPRKYLMQLPNMLSRVLTQLSLYQKPNRQLKS